MRSHAGFSHFLPVDPEPPPGRRPTPQTLALFGLNSCCCAKTYGHLAPDSDEYVRGLLNAYDGLDLEAATESR